MKIDEGKDFLLSLLFTFQKFDEDQKFLARTEVMNVLRRIRLSTRETTPNVHKTHMSIIASSVPFRQYFGSFAPGVPGPSRAYMHTTNPSTQNSLLSSRTTDQEPWDDISSDVSSIYSLQNV
jgi:hypothetical protein